MDENARAREAARRISDCVGFPVDNFFDYSDGFSFTVATELQAYKAAYKYQGPNIEKTVVRWAPNVSLWSVSIYGKD